MRVREYLGIPYFVDDGPPHRVWGIDEVDSVTDQPPAPADARPAAEPDLRAVEFTPEQMAAFQDDFAAFTVAKEERDAAVVRAEQAEARLAHLVEGLKDLEGQWREHENSAPESRAGVWRRCADRVRDLIVAAKQDQP